MAGDRSRTRKTTMAASLWGTEVLTLTANHAQPTSVECRMCMVKPTAGQTIYIGNSAAVSAADPVLDAGWTEFPVEDPSLLFFYSATATDKVFIAWFD